MRDRAVSAGVGDALTRSRAVTRRVLAVSLLSCAAAAVWALYVPGRELPPLAAQGTAERIASNDPAPAPLDLAAFDTPVWNIAEPAKLADAAPPPPPAPPPLKIQLLGIVHERGEYRAVLYDPDTNKVRVVASGEEVQGRRVERIAADSVSFNNGTMVQVLALKSPGVTP